MRGATARPYRPTARKEGYAPTADGEARALAVTASQDRAGQRVHDATLAAVRNDVRARQSCDAQAWRRPFRPRPSGVIPRSPAGDDACLSRDQKGSACPARISAPAQPTTSASRARSALSRTVLRAMAMALL